MKKKQSKPPTPAAEIVPLPNILLMAASQPAPYKVTRQAKFDGRLWMVRCWKLATGEVGAYLKPIATAPDQK